MKSRLGEEQKSEIKECQGGGSSGGEKGSLSLSAESHGGLPKLTPMPKDSDIEYYEKAAGLERLGRKRSQKGKGPMTLRPLLSNARA